MTDKDTLTIPLSVAAELGILGRLRNLGYKVPDEQEVDNQRLNREAAMRESVARLTSERHEAVAAKDNAYRERDMCVALIARGAAALGYRVGLGQHNPLDIAWEQDWRTIVFVDLPTGQVSWHIHDSERPWFEDFPTYDSEWDGHDTAEKYRRVMAFVKNAWSLPNGYGCATP